MAGSTISTTYTYNDAYQLVTAQEDGGPLWSYSYDGEGRLVEIEPDSGPEDSRRYSYSTAGFLEQVEIHDGSAFQPRAEMAYDGVGNRLSLTAHEAGMSLTTDYAADQLNRGNPLTATAAGDTTFYLYGRGVIAERTDTWAYYHYDLDATTRQITDPSGEVTLTRGFTPWGEPLEQFGEAEVAFGYFGGLLDAATGLIHLGQGQYYDPETGRFLAPAQGGFDPFQPGTGNPYVPLGVGDPLGALLGPLALLMFLPRRRKWGTKERVLLVVLLLLAGGGVLAACDHDPTPAPPPANGPPGEGQPTTPPGTTPPPEGGTPEPGDGTSTQVSQSTQPPPETTQPPPPSDTPTPEPEACPTPTVNPVSGDYYGRRFYEMLDSTAGWWNGYGSTEVTLSTYVAIVVNYELAGFHDDPEVHPPFTEAFARKYWDGCKVHGPAGCQIRNGRPDNAALNYLGSRDVVRTRVIAVQNGSRLEDLVRKEDYNYQQAVRLADDILAGNSGWKLGKVENRPWEWANLVESNPLWFERWIREGPIGPERDQIYAAFDRHGPQPLYFVTPGQQENWCYNKSCVELDDGDQAPRFIEELLGRS